MYDRALRGYEKALVADHTSTLSVANSQRPASFAD